MLGVQLPQHPPHVAARLRQDGGRGAPPPSREVVEVELVVGQAPHRVELGRGIVDPDPLGQQVGTVGEVEKLVLPRHAAVGGPGGGGAVLDPRRRESHW